MSGRWWALVSVALATFMTYLDNNVVNVALPTIQRELGLTISGLEWIVSAYILVFAGLLLVGGRLADVLGARTTFFAGLAVFTLASVAAGLAGGQETLIAARALQGVGAALVTPAALALLPKLFPDPRERGMAIGIWSAVGALALAVGPLTGGLLSESTHWGWIFLINVPIGAVTALVGLRSIRVARTTDTARTGLAGLDLPGLGTSAVALFALTYALIEGASRGWTSTPILGSFAVAAIAAIMFGVVESRTARPMIDLSLFRERIFSGGLLSMGLWAFGVFGIYFFTAIYLQSALGFSPTEAGAGFVPMALVMAVGAVLAPRIAERLGDARTVAIGLAVMAGAVAMVSTVGEGDGYLDLLPWFLLYGAGGGLLVPLTNVVLGAMPAARAGVASGVLNVSREVFGLLGITILGAIMSSRQSAVTGTPMHRFLEAYQFTLLIAAVIVLVGVPVSLYSLRRARTASPEPAAVADSAVAEPVA
ncbi:DHA2 family efflux MFS transporter permease subunit [Sphaerimonospora thailandensis]|uniref:MFS transporter n=1 Tax=Sphaerimonospora thailandensis TaxID=795644 RepID=A0A8J3RI11_9ACTN|nr:DHA2 family efflux MFS transporter permease subunit [Sphaerimonospora thailandensis]GIH72733.1 MFS transporter [Sphaerimonospora thailandensis]